MPPSILQPICETATLAPTPTAVGVVDLGIHYTDAGYCLSVPPIKLSNLAIPPEVSIDIG